jgi:hypothetical protein
MKIALENIKIPKYLPQEICIILFKFQLQNGDESNKHYQDLLF